MNKIMHLFPNVELDSNSEIGPFVILGHPPMGKKPGEEKLILGSNSHIRSHTVIYAGSIIGSRFQTGHHVLIREYCHIGDDCSVGTGSILEFKVKLGNRVRLHSQVFIPEYCIIEDDAWIGPRVVLTNAKFPASPYTKNNLKGVVVRKGAMIGANSTILPGIVVGTNSLVGAGSVVTKDVSPQMIVVGNPARINGRIDELRLDELNTLIYPDKLEGAHS